MYWPPRAWMSDQSNVCWLFFQVSASMLQAKNFLNHLLHQPNAFKLQSWTKQNGTANQPPPPPPSQIKDEAAQEPKRTIFPSLILSKIVDRNINKGPSIIYCEIDQVRGHYWFTEQSGFSYSQCFVMWSRISTAHGRETITHHVGVYFLLWNQNCFFSCIHCMSGFEVIG